LVEKVKGDEIDPVRHDGQLKAEGVKVEADAILCSIRTASGGSTTATRTSTGIQLKEIQ
jgi:hypothetical protein